MSDPHEKDGVIPNAESPQRRRVKQLAIRLLKAAALGGAAVSLAAVESCTPLVCDPLPPPMTCPNPTHAELVNAMTLSAAWETGDAGVAQVRLTVQSFGRTTINFSTMVTVTGGAQVGAATASPDNLVVVFTADPGATEVLVAVSFTCDSDGGTAVMTVKANTSAAPNDGHPVPVSIDSP